MVGTVFAGRYRILRPLGEGGMGHVYLAEHLLLGRKEAVKVLHPRFARHPEFLARFRREARATNRLQHPSIVAVHDFGQAGADEFYLAMEFAPGERLDHLIRRVGRVPVGRAVGLLTQLADAVDHAHTRGVVHRDLKPANLVVGEHRGRDLVKVLDFGVAKIIAPDYVDSVGLTGEGQVLGTPAYMAPEYIAGARADPRSDLYAVGCIAWEMLVGEPPFRGRTMEILHAHQTIAPARPSVRQSEVPRELDEVLMHLLEKDPAQRFQSGAELAAALEPMPGARRRRARDDDFGHDDTVVESAPAPTQASPATEEVVPQSPRRAAAALLELGARVLSESPGDVALILALDEVRRLDAEATRLMHEIDALDDLADRVEQEGREREAALDLALSELRFGGETDSAGRIAELEGRVAELTAEVERAIAELSTRVGQLEARRGEVDERLAERTQALQALLSERMARDPSEELTRLLKRPGAR